MTDLVIGYGQLGRALVERLLAAGRTVRVFDLQPAGHPEVESIVGDLRKVDDVQRACAGVETVYHTASMVNQSLGQPPLLYAVNVTGTHHVIEACQRQGVHKLVYSSSIDVVFDGTPINGGNESLRYPAQHLDYYGTTKMLAERSVIDANESGGLLTCSLRVAGMYGPHDRHRFPPIMQMALKGRFTRIGNGLSRFSHVFVDNVAHAHILAADRLRAGAAPAGQCYFITDHAATNFFDFFLPFFAALRLKVREITLPVRVAEAIASTYEIVYRVLPGRSTVRPPLTHYIVASTSRDFWFTHQRATTDFGYRPVVTQEEARQRTLAWLEQTWMPAHRS